MNLRKFLTALFVSPMAGFFRRKSPWKFAGKSICVGGQEYTICFWYQFHDGKKLHQRQTVEHKALVMKLKGKGYQINVDG